MKLDQDKSKSILLYVIQRANQQDPHGFGKTKLWKILWKADTMAVRCYGTSITGLTSYQKQPYGPVPQ